MRDQPGSQGTSNTWAWDMRSLGAVYFGAVLSADVEWLHGRLVPARYILSSHFTVRINLEIWKSMPEVGLQIPRLYGRSMDVVGP